MQSYVELTHSIVNVPSMLELLMVTISAVSAASLPGVTEISSEHLEE